jgi:coenzyme F420-0:L-glutamate ligase/coenzyme F420-1:gamma-L-glutamate ligase
MQLSFTAVPGIGDIGPKDDLPRVLGDALLAADLVPRGGDVLVVAQKIVSKAENRCVDLAAVVPSEQALALAIKTAKDPRLVELVLRESDEVVKFKPGVIVVAHRRGYVMAQAGIDRSNIGPDTGGDYALLLPEDCDSSAAALREGLCARFGVAFGVIVSDSFGRAWRKGTVNVALGVAGLPALIDRRGEPDRYGRVLEHTETGFADAIAAGAGLVMGEAGEGTPVVLARGLAWTAPDSTGQALVRPKTEDLFR